MFCLVKFRLLKDKPIIDMQKNAFMIHTTWSRKDETVGKILRKEFLWIMEVGHLCLYAMMKTLQDEKRLKENFHFSFDLEP